MTSLVNDETTYLALISLFSEAPYEVLAVAAEGGLLEEPWHEAVILDHIDILLLESALPAPQLVVKTDVGVAGPEGVLARVVLRIVRHGAAAADADAAATDEPIDDQSTSMVSRATRERLVAGDTGLSGTEPRSDFAVPRLPISRHSVDARAIPLRESTRNVVDDDRTRTERRPRAGAVTRRTDRRRYVSRLARAMPDGRRSGRRGEREKESKVGWRGQRERERDDETI